MHRLVIRLVFAVIAVSIAVVEPALADIDYPDTDSGQNSGACTASYYEKKGYECLFCDPEQSSENDAGADYCEYTYGDDGYDYKCTDDFNTGDELWCLPGDNPPPDDDGGNGDDSGEGSGGGERGGGKGGDDGTCAVVAVGSMGHHLLWLFMGAVGLGLGLVGRRRSGNH